MVEVIEVGVDLAMKASLDLIYLSDPPLGLLELYPRLEEFEAEVLIEHVVQLPQKDVLIL